MNNLQSIIATLVYHNIFDYPLKAEEVWHFKIGQKSTLAADQKGIELLIKQQKIQQKSDLIFLKGRGEITKLRLKRFKYSQKKIKRARFYAQILKYLPSVRLVALTGALSMENSDKKDDIDFLIVTEKSTLWTTRLLVNLLLYPYKRKPGKPQTDNKACLNIFLAKNSLKITTQNLYTAHEIAQIKPIWQRGNTYLSLIKANSWIKNYLPNWQPASADSFDTYPQSGFLFPVTCFLSRFEKYFKIFQIQHMRHRITTEKIGEKQLFFHPADTQQWVLTKYDQKLKLLR